MSFIPTSSLQKNSRQAVDNGKYLVGWGFLNIAILAFRNVCRDCLQKKLWTNIGQAFQQVNIGVSLTVHVMYMLFAETVSKRNHGLI